jgi:polar amino acid transport system substrate-binding protein
MERNMKKLFIALILLLSSSVLQAQTITLASAMGEKSRGNVIAQAIVKEISNRTGMEIKTIVLPRKRIIHLLANNSDTIDGVLLMYDGLEKENSHLIKISELFLASPIVAVSKRTDIEINGWESLKGYKLAQPQGGKFITKNLSSLGLKAHPLNKPEQGLKFVLAGRADMYLTPPFLVMKLMKKPEFNTLQLLTPHVAINRYFSYFFKRNADAAQKYLTTLKAIKEDGTYKKILEQTK